jgi:predicted nucleic acid-binding protein
MTVAFVDTSCLVAIAFSEPGAAELAARLREFDLLVGSNLLEAELRAVLAREEVSTDIELLERITWLIPDRPLSREITTVLGAGYLRGADLWHLACALFLSGSPRELPFLTLDERQGAVAHKLGFPA